MHDGYGLKKYRKKLSRVEFFGEVPKGWGGSRGALQDKGRSQPKIINEKEVKEVFHETAIKTLMKRKEVFH